MNKRNEDAAVPMLAGMIDDGVIEGVFDTSDPWEAAALIVHMSSTVGEKQMQLLLHH